MSSKAGLVAVAVIITALLIVLWCFLHYCNLLCYVHCDMSHHTCSKLNQTCSQRYKAENEYMACLEARGIFKRLGAQIPVATIPCKTLVWAGLDQEHPSPWRYPYHLILLTFIHRRLVLPTFQWCRVLSRTDGVAALLQFCGFDSHHSHDLKICQFPQQVFL